MIVGISVMTAACCCQWNGGGHEGTHSARRRVGVTMSGGNAVVPASTSAQARVMLYQP